MINKKLGTVLENVAESGAACLVTMVQGNVLALGLSHWLIASQTGLVAGTAAAAALTLARTDNRWIVAALLGVTTALVDYFMHPGSFGWAATEAMVTGAGAAALSLAVGAILRRRAARRGLQS